MMREHYEDEITRGQRGFGPDGIGLDRVRDSRGSDLGAAR